MWAQALSTLLGLWLMASPAVLGYGDPAQTVDRILGPIAASLAVVAMGEATRSVRHANLLIGILLLIAPWVLGYAAVPTVNSMLVGLAILSLSRVRGRVRERFDGGWSRIWRGYPAGER